MEQQCRGAEGVGDLSSKLSRTVGRGAPAATLLAVVLHCSRSGACVSCVCRSYAALMEQTSTRSRWLVFSKSSF